MKFVCGGKQTHIHCQLGFNATHKLPVNEVEKTIKLIVIHFLFDHYLCYATSIIRYLFDLKTIVKD